MYVSQEIVFDGNICNGFHSDSTVIQPKQWHFFIRSNLLLFKYVIYVNYELRWEF